MTFKIEFTIKNLMVERRGSMKIWLYELLGRAFPGADISRVSIVEIPEETEGR